MEYCIINCTAGNKEEALKISRELVKKKLIACSNIIPSITSVYSWEGRISGEAEVLMLMKTKTALFDRVKEEILKLHSYEVPEIIAVPVINGSESYIKWIDENTKAVM